MTGKLCNRTPFHSYGILINTVPIFSLSRWNDINFCVCLGTLHTEIMVYRYACLFSFLDVSQERALCLLDLLFKYCNCAASLEW